MTQGRPCRTIRDSIFDELRTIAPNADRRGRIKEWIGHGMNRS